MSHIQQLAPHVAELIAAGEVVERPASVVKELVENAIDAGASAIVAEIRRGGMGLIRVTDNGCGIAPEELPTAFLRHATSKLREESDLEQIGTLGFRGEALAAISVVSRVEIQSRQRDADSGASLHLEGGVRGEVESIGAPVGTTVTVRDLFYNTPARLKFMRKDSAETAAVAGLMQHLALSHPSISFRFIKDGTVAMHTPGDGKLDSAIYAALGREFAKSLLPVKGRGGDVEVSGFVTQPLLGRGSRSMQTFFVNGRFIKSQILTAAVEEAYRNQLMKGKFPGCVLFVTLPVTLVDVNVHPAKTQVKFAREKDVFDAVYHTVLDCLDAKCSEKPEPEHSVTQMTNPRQDFFQTMDAKTYREQVVHSSDKSAPKKTELTPSAWNSERRAATKVADSAPNPKGYALFQTPEKSVGVALGRPPASVTEEPPQQPTLDTTPVDTPETSVPDVPVSSQTREKPFVPAIPAAQETFALPEQQTIEPEQEVPWRLVGELFHTYILCESADGCVWLIDKHAAHERIHFDRLKERKQSPMRQTLLQPVAAELGREDCARLLEHLPMLEDLGFACEDFGDGTILVREVPAELDVAEVVTTLEAFAENLRTGRSMDEKREQVLHTMACKAAIKGGWVSDPTELQVLVEAVQRGKVRYCPHGRPVATRLTQYQLEKMFKRV